MTPAESLRDLARHQETQANKCRLELRCPPENVYRVDASLKAYACVERAIAGALLGFAVSIHQATLTREAIADAKESAKNNSPLPLYPSIRPIITPHIRSIIVWDLHRILLFCEHFALHL
jgi:hypothetical protein